MAELIDQLRELWASGDNWAVVLLAPPGAEDSLSPGEAALLRYYRGCALYRLGDIRTGVRELRAAYDLVDHVESPVDACWLTIGYAVTLGKRGDHERAVRVLKSARDRYRPEGVQHAYLVWHLGWQLVKAGDPQGLHEIRQAIHLLGASVDRWWATLDLAEALLEAGDPHGALCCLDSLATVRAERPAIWRARFDCVRGEALIASGRIGEAVEAAVDAVASAQEAASDEVTARALLLAARVAELQGGEASNLAKLAADHALRARNGVLASEALTISSGEGR